MSDRGYNSMTQEDVKRMSQMVISTADDSASSPASSDVSDTNSNKVRMLWWASFLCVFVCLMLANKYLLDEEEDILSNMRNLKIWTFLPSAIYVLVISL